jgi:hypothetical protein
MEHLIRLACRAAIAVLVFSPHAGAIAQGVASSGIHGSVRVEGADGALLYSSARVHLTQTATGVASDVQARQGRFIIDGLEPGGPYTVTVQRLGFVAQQRDGVFLKLGELLELDFVLRPVVTRLDSVNVVASQASSSSLSYARGGTAARIGEQLLSKMPTLNRDYYDFVRLVPQISTKV